MKKAFTLAEVLITLGVIGVVAALTVPQLMMNQQKKELVAGVLKFSSSLQQAVQLWKRDNGCDGDIYKCIIASGGAEYDTTIFEQIMSYMRVNKITNPGSSSLLPDNTYNYFGDAATGNYGKVAKAGYGNGAYSLPDGMTLVVDANSSGYCVTVDVNGKKAPNRVGKDVFNFSIGNYSGKDIFYYPTQPNYSYSNTLGLCGANSSCDANNPNPSSSPYASSTAYVILNHELPDFKALSQTVSGFKP